jgi:shikimate 5-dehydrogenase
MLNEKNKIIEKEKTMSTYESLSRYVDNDLLNLSDNLFKHGPVYKPSGLTTETFDNEPISMIIGQHPSEYALSPELWNAEFFLSEQPEIFLPADVPVEKQENLFKLLDYALEVGNEHFRVLTITNPHKVEAFEHMKKWQMISPEKIVITEDANKIGATNQILIDSDNVFHVINSDGQGMANAVENFLGATLAGKKVGVLGSGGAGRGIIYEIAKRVSAQAGGSVTVFNRTVEKAVDLVEEFRQYFPEVEIEAKSLADLTTLAKLQDVLVSSITAGDPLLENQAYNTLPKGALIVDANYDDKSVFAKNAKEIGRSDLNIHDGSGMVVEGYVIPSKLKAELWGYEVPPVVYNEVAKMYGYGLKEK